MMMLEQFTVENFKAFKSLTLDDLGHINIFVGDNNVGKTCLLEAIAFSLVVDNFFKNRSTIANINCFAWLKLERDSIEALFYSKNKVIDPRFTIALSDEEKYKFTIVPQEESGVLHIASETLGATNTASFYGSSGNKYSLYNVLPAETVVFLTTYQEYSALAEYYFDGCIDNNREDYVLNLLKESSETRLQRISYISNTRLRVGLAGLDHKYSLSSLGDGFSKLLGIASVLYSSDRQYLCIDEPENGFHYKTQTSFWKLLANWSLEGDKQSFIATHSYELISCLNDLLTKDKSLLERGLKVRVHQLKRDEDDPELITVDTITEENLTWLLEHGTEIR